MFTKISAKEAAMRLNTGEAALVLDVRTPVEFSEVHATAAVNVPLDRLEPEALVESGQARREESVYVLCRSGQRACKAADKLAAAGFSKVAVVEGGTLAWVDAGLPVVRGTAKVIGLERQVRIVAGVLVVTGVLLAHFVNGNFVWLSAFVGAGLVFAGVTDFCGMGLLLARMPWNRRV